MAGDLPLRWHADGLGPALSAAESIAARLVGGESTPWPPPGFAVVKDRPMRVVLRGDLPGRAGASGPAVAAYLKVRRARGAWERVRAASRPRSPAEGRVLLRLSERGVAVPEVLAWSARPADGVDVLVLAAVPGAVDLAAWASRARARAARLGMAEDVGRLLRRAHEAGWMDRDFHRGNLLVAPQGLVLVDAGTRMPSRPLSIPRRVAALAVAAHGLSADARSGLAALRAYSDGDRAAARRWLALVAPAARIVARSYRRGRARRPTRTGRHFEVFRPFVEGGRAVRSVDATPPAWRDLAPALLARRPDGARDLKDDGRVLAARLPGREGEVVVKRFDAVWRDRLRTPRALRAFRRAYALRIRGVACPEPLLAAADPSGASVYVAALAGPVGASPVDLDAALRPRAGGRSLFASLSRVERRAALHRLGRFLRRMHDAEVSHRDLKAPNLVAWRGARRVHFAVVDLEGARARRRAVPWRRRALDLARLDASAGPAVSRADRLRVLRGYYAAFERPRLALDAMADLVARASARKRRRLGAAR